MLAPPRRASRRSEPRLGTVSRDGSPACSRRLGSAFLARPHLPRPTAPPRTGARRPHFGLPLAASAGNGVLSESAAPGLSPCIRLLTIASIHRLVKRPSRVYRLYANNRISTFKDDQRLSVKSNSVCSRIYHSTTDADCRSLRTKHVAIVNTVQIKGMRIGSLPVICLHACCRAG